MHDTALLRLAEKTAPHWAEQSILPFPEDAFRIAQRFASRHYWIAAGSVNVFRVAGTRHPDYAGMSWGDFLRRGKRMPANHALWERNPGYYLETGPKEPGMSYVSLDGLDWYVDDDGNHRTCIARFAFGAEGRTMLHGVTLSDWRSDTEFVEAYRALEDLVRERRIGWNPQHKSTLVRREDTAGWKLDHYDHRLFLAFGRMPPGFPDLLNAAGVRKLIAYASTPAWRRWFGRSPGAA